MDKKFWINAWEEGRTSFHRHDYNEKLLKHFPLLDLKSLHKVLVPLCGKSKDLLWLSCQNLQVHGVELYEKAIEEFFIENKLSNPHVSTDEHFKHYSAEGITLSCGDFFNLPEINTYSFVYDRAALVALPSAMRTKYADVIKRSLRKGGKYFLIVYEYDQSKMEGPPFSVSSSEVHSLYEDSFDVNLIESSGLSDGGRLSAVPGLVENVYVLVRK